MFPVHPGKFVFRVKHKITLKLCLFDLPVCFRLDPRQRIGLLVQYMWAFFSVRCVSSWKNT